MGRRRLPPTQPDRDRVPGSGKSLLERRKNGKAARASASDPPPLPQISCGPILLYHSRSVPQEIPVRLRLNSLLPIIILTAAAATHPATPLLPKATQFGIHRFLNVRSSS